jgi:hypothetical protein
MAPADRSELSVLCALKGPTQTTFRPIEITRTGMDVLWYRDAVHRWLRPDRTIRDHTTSGICARDPHSAAVTWDDVWQGRAEIWVSGNPDYGMPCAWPNMGSGVDPDRTFRMAPLSQPNRRLPHSECKTTASQEETAVETWGRMGYQVPAGSRSGL